MRTARQTATLLALAAGIALGCGGTGSGDAGTIDAGPIDAGTIDAGPIDAGPIDAGPIDAGPIDAGPIDAGPIDAGPIDAGPIDAGPIDAGPVDAGPIDAGPIDAGPIDAGPIDAGVVEVSCTSNAGCTRAGYVCDPYVGDSGPGVCVPSCNIVPCAPESDLTCNSTNGLCEYDGGPMCDSAVDGAECFDAGPFDGGPLDAGPVGPCPTADGGDCCESDSECHSSEWCQPWGSPICGGADAGPVYDECDGGDSSCGSDLLCVEAPPPGCRAAPHPWLVCAPACTGPHGSNPCRPGEGCSNTGRCVPLSCADGGYTCPRGAQCTDNTCVATRCLSDAQCDESYCVNGSCLPTQGICVSAQP